MKHNLKISYYKPDKQGAFPITNGYCFAAEMESEKENGVLLYAGNREVVRIPFSKEGKCGTLYGVIIETPGKKFPFAKYNFYEGEKIFTDPYAKVVSGLEKWGEHNQKRETFGVLIEDVFDWENDKPLEFSIKNSVLYGLNVRAFTMHKSSCVKNKGTFEGIVEKIPHFKKIGITMVELMPAYEYEECMGDEINRNLERKRVNCWGFQKGFYFAPKASYSMERPDISFKKMVKELHKNEIEISMHFYFPPESNPSHVIDVLRYWVTEYHIDGVRLSGFHIPLVLIAADPMLKTTKVRSAYIPTEEIYGDIPPVYRHLLEDSPNFRSDMRRYLKGDENLVNQVMYHQKNNSSFHGIVNYIADYDGFSLFDLVSYEHKHNEANGEENRDGTDFNYSWNCGAEGESRKKNIMNLRKKQLKNALGFVFLSQGVPYLFSGDEFGNTRYGNNNVYCQDNETGFVKWKKNQFSNDILQFTCDMILLRKNHSLLHREKEFQLMDSHAFGYPDISYHGTEAWRPNVSYTSRMFGIMIYGKYAEEKEAESLYIAYNMHWEKQELALPKLPKGKKWVKIMSTAEEYNDNDVPEENKILAEGRSISLYCSKTDISKYKEKSSKSEKDSIKNESVETF